MKALVVYAGESSLTEGPGDLWTWDGSTWLLHSPVSASPLVNSDRFAMAYDAERGNVVLFSLNVGTWIWSGLRWLQMSPTTSPSAPTVMSENRLPMAWDPERKALLLFEFSGPAAGEMLNEMWAWNGNNWKLIDAVNPPAGHYSTQSGMAYDTARHSMVFFGHVNGKPTTWTLNSVGWLKAPTESGPPSERFTMASYDAGSRVLLYGEQGDTWTWDGSQWTAQNPQHTPGQRYGASMTYDPIQKVTVLFGGRSKDGSYLNDLWNWNGSDWSRVFPK